MSGVLDRALAMFQVLPYRCRRCRNRFYQFVGFGRQVEDRQPQPQAHPALWNPVLTDPATPVPMLMAEPAPEETPILCRLTFSQSPEARTR